MTERASRRRLRCCMMTILATLAVQGGTAVADTCPVPTESMEAPAGESLFMNSLKGEPITGSKDALLASAAKGEALGVSWYNWEGQVFAECTRVKITEDLDVKCQIDAWCDDPVDGIPGAHAQRITLTSVGTTSTLVMSVRESTGERSLLAVSSNPSPVEWFSLDVSEDRAMVEAD